MNIEITGVKNYLDYLDKEMTIMGILSSFCILVAGFVLDKLLFYDIKTPPPYIFWNHVNTYCMIGLVCLLLASLFFYRQRSLLAYYNGQISLYLGKKDLGKVEENLDDADSWGTWKFYDIAWGFLTISFLTFVLGLISQRFYYFEIHQIAFSVCIITITVLPFGFHIYSMHKYPDCVNPRKELMKSIREKLK